MTNNSLPPRLILLGDMPQDIQEREVRKLDGSKSDGLTPIADILVLGWMGLLWLGSE